MSFHTYPTPSSVCFVVHKVISLTQYVKSLFVLGEDPWFVKRIVDVAKVAVF